MITSTKSERVKKLKQLQTKAKARRSSGLFVAEGERLVREVPQELLNEVYISEGYTGAYAFPETIPCEILSDSVFASVTDTETPQGILAVVKTPAYDSTDFYHEDGVYLFLETLQDPGNLGTIFRTAEGAGISGIVMNPFCVDPFLPKTVRGAMGSLFRMPFLVAEDFLGEILRIKACGIRVYAAALTGSVPYSACDYEKGTAFLIGNEGNGLTEEAISLSDQRIRIPMEGQLESLNASVAASILMYEAKRQRDRL